MQTFALLSLGHMVNDGTTMFIPIVATILLAQAEVSVLLITLLSTAFYTSTTLTSPFVGTWADSSRDPGRLMALGLFLLMIAFLGFYAGVSMPPGLPKEVTVLVSALVAGMGNAFFHPLAGAIIHRGFPQQSKGRVLGANGLFGALGAAVYPPVFLVIAGAYTTAGMFWGIALLGLCSAAAIGTSLKSGTTKGPIEGRRHGMLDAVNRPIALLALITGIRSVASGGLTFWLPRYIEAFRGTGVSAVLGLSLGFAYIASIPGQAVLGYLTDRFDKRAILGLGAVGTAIVTVGYIYTSGLASLVFLLFFGFFTFSNFPTIVGLATDYSGDASPTSAIAVAWGIGTTVGNIIGPAIVGLVIGSSTGALPSAFLLMAAISIAGALATPLMPKPRGQRRVQKSLRG